MTAQPHQPGHASRHRYDIALTWTGNEGTGTADYTSYRRDHRIMGAGKRRWPAAPTPRFAARERYNPEELLVAALAACHMLAYLALCARGGVCVTGYDDRATGTLSLDADGGRFELVELQPVVTVADAAMHDRAQSLHEIAHRRCFIANSCRMPVHVKALVRVEGWRHVRRVARAGRPAGCAGSHG